ncbi:MAG: Sensor protein [uncultured bacterium]|nr:MAG: Sensor protein [uncultured bacterium]
MKNKKHFFKAIKDKISSRREASKAIKDKKNLSNVNYKAIVDTITIGIQECDNTGKITFANNSYMEIMHAGEKDVIGNYIWNFLATSEEIDRFKKYFQYLIDKQPKPNTFTAKNKTIDGKIIHVQVDWNYKRNTSNEITGFISTVIDITQAVSYQRNIQKEKDLAKKYLDVAGVMFIVIGKDMKVKMINKTGLEILECNENDILDRNWFDEFLTPENKSMFLSAFENLIANKLPNNKEYNEISIVAKSGKQKTIAWHHSIILDDNDNFLATLSSGQDITERKLYEEQIKNLNEQLINKNEELKQFLYASTHDLRSPLFNIQGFCGELQRYNKELSSIMKDKNKLNENTLNLEIIINKDIPEAIDFIHKSVLKMDDLLSGLLRISNLDKAETKAKILDMNLMFKKIMENFQYQIQTNSIEIDVAKIHPCMADALQINQVFSNIVDNAIKYMRSGQKGKISVSSIKFDKNIIYQVKDNGIGISKKYYEKIFEIFYRLEPNKTPGHGIGMAIVKKILAKNNGDIWLESEVGIGTTFFVSLPCVKE